MSKLSNKDFKDLLIEWYSNFINETVDRKKINDEAWELVGNGLLHGDTNQEIMNFVKDELGLKEWLPNDKNFESKINVLTDQMIKLIHDEKMLVKEVSYEEIKNFKNLENPEEKKHSVLKKAHEISLSNDSDDIDKKSKLYDKLMVYRDNLGGGRNRGYSLSNLFEKVALKGDYPFPFVIKINNKDYVIGGRTRIYAAVAAGVPIKIYYLNAIHLKKIE